jgi:hypothetical protein
MERQLHVPKSRETENVAISLAVSGTKTILAKASSSLIVATSVTSPGLIGISESAFHSTIIVRFIYLAPQPVPYPC